MSALIWHPGKAQQVAKILCTRSPFPTYSISLFSEALMQISNDSGSIDLSDSALEDSHLVEIFSRDKDWSSLKRLNLSHNSHISTETVLVAVPNLQRLVLMECPAVENKPLRELIESSPPLFYRIKALMHPLFLNVAETSLYPAAFTCFSLRFTLPRIKGCSIPFENLSTVICSLVDYLGCYSFGEGLFLTQEAPMYAIQAAFTSASRAPGADWGTRSVVLVPSLVLSALFGDQAGWTFVTDMDFKTMAVRWAFLRLRAPARPCVCARGFGDTECYFSFPVET